MKILKRIKKTYLSLKEKEKKKKRKRKEKKKKRKEKEKNVCCNTANYFGQQQNQIQH